MDYLGFKTELWSKQIKKGKGEREWFFIHFAAEKARHSSFYNESSNQYAPIFVDEGILAQDESGYFIAHDIYEEWALVKHVDILYRASSNIEDFFSRVGSSLPLRRAFRNWLGDILGYDEDVIVSMVDVVRDGMDVEPFWKDEILISILLSNQSQMFFRNIRNELLGNELFLLKRIAALLVTSCKVFDMEYSRVLAKNVNESLYLITAPIGEGWKSFVRFVYDEISSVGIDNIGFIFKVLHDWVFHNTTGNTSRHAGLLALHYYEWLQAEQLFNCNNGFEKKILRIIVMSSSEIKIELKVLLDKVVDNKWNHRKDPYYDPCDFIIGDMSGNYIAEVLTEELIQIIKLYWTERNVQKHSSLYGHSTSLEPYYGLNENNLSFYPSSPYKTPVRRILNADFKRGLEFCIWFANYTTEHYLKSSLSKKEVWTMPIERSNGSKVEIQVSNRLWCVYRGSQTNPDVLESVFMALEKELLRIGDALGGEILVPYMLYIIDNTNSAILFGLIASIICAYPDQMFEVALQVFKTELFFLFDNNRLSVERGFMIGGTPGDRFYIKERETSRNLNHRKISLEELFTNYAIYYSKQSDDKGSSRLDELFAILDRHYDNLGNADIQSTITWRMSLGRMDIRKMKVQETIIEEHNYHVYTPIFDDEVEKTRLAILLENNKNVRYFGLLVWCKEKFDRKNISDHSMFYDKDTNNVFKEFNQYLSDQQEGDAELGFIDKELKYMVPAVMYRDYYSSLNVSQIELCENLIIEGVLLPYHDAFEFDALNGVSYAYASLPLLALRSIESVIKIERFLILALLDVNPIDAISALKKIVELGNVEFVKGLMSKYASVSVLYKNYSDKYKMQDSEQRRLNTSEKLIRKFSVDLESEIACSIIDSEVNGIDLQNLQPDFKAKCFQILSIIREDNLTLMKHTLAHDVLNHYYETKMSNSRFRISDGFIKSYCELMLTSGEIDRKKLFIPVAENRVTSDVTCDIALEMIKVEDSLQEREKFWWWMKELKQMLIEEVSTDNAKKTYLSSKNSKIIRTLMLSETGRNSSALEWHSLDKIDMLYFKDITESLCYHPDVLWSMLKLMNGIGTVHFKVGMSIIADMFRNSNGFAGISISEDIVQYLEITVRKFVNQFRNEIRKNTKVRIEVITILNWLVEQESVLGYMLRDDLL